MKKPSLPNTYLYRLFQKDRPLFYLIAGYLFFTGIFNFMGDEVTPFFVWGMFSMPDRPDETYEIFEIKIDGEVYDYANTGIDFQRHYTKTPLVYYHEMSKLGEDPTRYFFKTKTGEYYPSIAPYLTPITNDATEYDAYPAWLDRYLEATIGRNIDQLEVNVLTVQYQVDGTVKWLQTKPLLRHEG